MLQKKKKKIKKVHKLYIYVETEVEENLQMISPSSYCINYYSFQDGINFESTKI